MIRLLQNVLIFDQEDEKALLHYLNGLRRDETVLSYYQLQGFLFAVVCSPEPIKPSEWFDLIWLTDEPQFDGEEEARAFFQLVTSLANYIEGSVRQRRYLPFESTYSPSWQSQLREWSEGFLMGHQYLEDVWMIALDDLADDVLSESVDVSLSLALTFADGDSTQQLLLEEELGLTNDHLSDAYTLLWRSLDSYVRVGVLWSEGHWEFDAQQLFLSLESVAREELCPCGSGLIFAKCCLH